jgi:hypothetical protein
MKKILLVFLLCCAVVSVAGCVLPRSAGEPSIIGPGALTEPVWIRNGEPIVFEAEDWFPVDEVENLLDSEVYEAGTYRDVPFFIEKTDVRPFERIYTHFSKNRYRAFEQ